ncbi:MAG: protein-disulfide reductase DsbD family protein [Alphaproteobacteria bacterium]
MRLRTAIAGAVFALAALAVGVGRAAPPDHVEARLVSAVQAVGTGESLPLGLLFRMQPGWKIYWRSPGDAGYPPSAVWDGSGNLRAVEIAWPAPHRFSLFGLETAGYSDEVVLPLTVHPAAPGQPLHLRGRVAFLACNDICIPFETALALDLPAGPAAASGDANLIARYASRVPGRDERHGLSVERAVLEPADGDEVRLTVDVASLAPLTAPDLFVEGPEGSYFSAPSAMPLDGGRRTRLTVTGGGVAAAEWSAQPLVLTVVDGDRAAEVAAPVSLGGTAELAAGAAVAGPAPDIAVPAIRSILAIAVLGGLILNLMPCVLPVLAIKLAGVAAKSGGPPAAVRAGFLASAAGIVATVLAIAGVLAGLKAAGQAVGWGIQFQQPVFLIALVALVTLFACNLLGLFEIGLPRRLADALGRHHAPSSSFGSHFLTGALATLLATPCTAPFLGTAIGFALARGTGEILAVFAALGFGLALPYLLVAAFPGVAAALPRPGPWMIWLRRVLALALAGTAVWLLSVLAAQIGTENAVGIGVAMLLAGAVLAARRMPDSRLGRHAPLAVAALIAAALAVPFVRDDARPRHTAPAAMDAAWQGFDLAAIPGLVAAGRTVLVDVTADWCVTCQVNKALVLDRAPVAGWLADGTVIAMRADWTRPDPAISDYLAGFGRYGIPFNVVYGPAAPDGIPLPELLTTGAVADALAAVGGPRR